MSQSLALAAVVTLAALLALASAAAGAFWWRSRSMPLVRVARLAKDLAERQEALEALIARLEPQLKRRPTAAREMPARKTHNGHSLRLDPAQESAHEAGPTLISVPDLAAPAAVPPAASELSQRFGPVWEMADRGSTVAAIARATGQPIGQVELILGLRRQLAAAMERP